MSDPRTPEQILCGLRYRAEGGKGHKNVTNLSRAHNKCLDCGLDDPWFYEEMDKARADRLELQIAAQAGEGERIWIDHERSTALLREFVRDCRLIDTVDFTAGYARGFRERVKSHLGIK